eukprot:78142_1
MGGTSSADEQQTSAGAERKSSSPAPAAIISKDTATTAKEENSKKKEKEEDEQQQKPTTTAEPTEPTTPHVIKLTPSGKVPAYAKGTSLFRGVAQHRITRRWEAHIWDKRRQVYLGSFETERQAAVAFDRAYICLKAGVGAENGPVKLLIPQQQEQHDGGGDNDAAVEEGNTAAALPPLKEEPDDGGGGCGESTAAEPADAPKNIIKTNNSGDIAMPSTPTTPLQPATPTSAVLSQRTCGTSCAGQVSNSDASLLPKAILEALNFPGE